MTELERLAALPVSAGGSMMSGMGPSFPDMIFLFLLALVIFGPKKLPEIGRQVGKLLNELKRASNEFKAQIQTEMDNMEQEEKAQKMLAPAEPPPGAIATLSLKPQPVSDSEAAESGEVIDLKPIDAKPMGTEPIDAEYIDQESIVIHPLEGEVSNGHEGSDRDPHQVGSAQIDPTSESGTNSHQPDAVIKATNV
ncbi:MAG TPA: twin-arginine translocase TatA/TatE family subunit [Terriglobales bacterium]|jgi:TatA/E family protein of Tat protein translocase